LRSGDTFCSRRSRFSWPDGRDDAVVVVLVSNLESTVSDPLEMISAEASSGRSTFGTPSITALIQAVRPIIQLNGAHPDALRDAKRVAAEKRIEAILSHSRRRHYGHAAMLAAACVWGRSRAIWPIWQISDLADLVASEPCERASRTECDLAKRFDQEPNRTSERVEGLGAKPPDQKVRWPRG
jgi:hypothetical protein